MQSWIHNPLSLSFKDQGFRSHGYKVGALIGRIVQTRILGQGLTKTSVEHSEVGDLMLSCAENSGVLAVASKSSPGESLRAEMLYKCGNLMLGCWRHYWGLLEATGIDFKAVGNTQSQN
ncbi:hypothetical protein QL285_048013 [Trifolium repens]|nr:hypothetical protein QL285_048012 [Trifolium repens]KAK2412860.1 hypothetical protein QL285_048013 [Trifolium repens]